MKKLYFLLVAMLVGFAANADYYLIGGFNSWTTSDATCKFEEQADGTWVLDYAGTLTSGFKINDGTWANDAANFGGSAVLQLGVPYSLTVGGSSGNIPLAENIENPHLVLIPAAKILTITGQSVEAKTAYGIHGDIFGGTTWTTTELEEKDGKWSVTANVIPGDFGIKVMDADSGSQTDWINSTTGVTVTYGTPMPCTKESDAAGDNWHLTAVGAVEFIFDPEAMTLTVNASEVPAKEITFYFDNTTAAWDEITAIFSNDEGEDEYLMEETTQPGIFMAFATENFTKVKFTDGGSNTTALYDLKDSYIYSPDNSGEPYTLPVDYSQWYVNVIGDFNEWLDNGVNPDETGVAELTGLEIGTSPFKVKVWDGAAEAWFSTGGVINLDEWTTIYGNRDANMSVAGAAEGNKYNVKFNVKTNAIFITLDAGVEGVMIDANDVAPVYYNLQGVRVAEPANGLYIVRRGDKVAKEIVR